MQSQLVITIHHSGYYSSYLGLGRDSFDNSMKERSGICCSRLRHFSDDSLSKEVNIVKYFRRDSRSVRVANNTLTDISGPKKALVIMRDRDTVILYLLSSTGFARCCYICSRRV